MKRLLFPLLAIAATGCFRDDATSAASLAPDASTNAPAISTDGVRRVVAPPVMPGLSFYLVAEDSEARARALVSATDGAAPDGFLATPDDYGFVRDSAKPIDSAKLHAFGDPPAGQICLIERLSETLYAPIFVEEEPVMRQLAAVRSCQAEKHPMTGQILVSVVLGKRDARAFADATAANARRPDAPGRRLAIVLGDAVLLAPLILEPIRDGRFVISGLHSLDEAERLASFLGAAAPDATAAPTPFVWDLFHSETVQP